MSRWLRASPTLGPWPRLDGFDARCILAPVIHELDVIHRIHLFGVCPTKRPPQVPLKPGLRQTLKQMLRSRPDDGVLAFLVDLGYPR
jgi:hypothetical protein